MTFDISSKTDYDTDNSSNADINTAAVSLQAKFVFYIFLLLDIPSVFCSLLLFYCFAHLPELRQQRQSNQIIIYLLVGTFLVAAVDVPLILPYLQNHYYIQFMKYPNSFCIFWIMYDYGMYSINLWLMALVCLERYLLIFFKQIVMKSRKRYFFLYYVPVTLIVLFVFFWYLYLVALYPCVQTQFDYTQMVCGFPCYKTVGSVTVQNTDWALADLLPLFLAILFIFILISHVIYQKYKINKHLMQQDTWKRTRKMFLQLVPIAFIFLLFNIPLISVGLLAISNPWYDTTPYFYANYLSYCLALCMPFAVLSKQTAIRRRLFAWLRLRRFNRTGPMTITAQPMRLGNTQATQRMAEMTVKSNGVCPCKKNLTENQIFFD